MKRLRLVVGTSRKRRVGWPAKQLQSLGLGGGGEGVVTNALIGLARLHSGVQQLFGADFLSLQSITAENGLELAGRRTGLRRVRLVGDHRIAP
ncbi:hypothetical protein D9M69_702390 [compost metagenome]